MTLMADFIIDVKEVGALADALMVAIRDYYEHHSPGPQRPLEVLQAIAVAAGAVLAGTGDDPEACAYFAHAVELATHRFAEAPEVVGHA